MGTKNLFHPVLIMDAPFGHVFTDGRGFLKIHIKTDEISSEQIVHLSDELKEFYPDTKIPFLVDVSDSPPCLRSIRLLIDEKTSEFCSRIAIVSTTDQGKSIAKIFMTLTKTQCPISLFETEYQASEWLCEEVL